MSVRNVIKLVHTGYVPERDKVTPIPASVPARDMISHDGAAKLAAELDAWWHSRGYPQVKHWLIQLQNRPNAKVVCCVRSNLVNGLPPKDEPLGELLAKYDPAKHRHTPMLDDAPVGTETAYRGDKF